MAELVSALLPLFPAVPQSMAVDGGEEAARLAVMRDVAAALVALLPQRGQRGGHAGPWIGGHGRDRGELAVKEETRAYPISMYHKRWFEAALRPRLH